MMVTPRNTIFDLKDVSELTVEVLEACLEFSDMLGPEQNAGLIAEFYFENSDHGFAHSQAVWNRCLEIIPESPLLWQFANHQMVDGKVTRENVLILASIFHDMGRFLGVPFEIHEAVGAILAKRIVIDSGLERPLGCAIIHHDYISPVIDTSEMPVEAMMPLSEIFRLADKTSIAPKAEIIRYHDTGRRCSPDLPLFDSEIPDEVRFKFRRDIVKGDELSWMLIIFALQPTDFVYGETRDSYTWWSQGKREAIEEICQLLLVEEFLGGQPINLEEIRQLIARFCKKFNFIIPA